MVLDKLAYDTELYETFVKLLHDRYLVPGKRLNSWKLDLNQRNVHRKLTS